MSSDENNISAQLKIPAPKQNGVGVRRKRRAPVKTVYKNKKRSSISRARQREFSKRFASSPTCILRSGNFSSTPLYLPTSKQSVPGVLPFWGQQNGHVESVSEHENLSSTFHSKSPKFHMSSKPPLHTSVAFNDPTSYCYKINGCIDNTFQREKQPSCRSARTSSTHKSISAFIRNSRIPRNINISLASSTTSSRGRSYSQPLSSHLTHSTPKDHSALEERVPIGTISQSINQPSIYPCPIFRISHLTSPPTSTTSHCIPKHPLALEERDISPCSTVVEVGNMETILGNTTSSSSTTEPPSLSESSWHSSELISDSPPNSLTSQTSSRESWDSEDGTESINQSFLCLLNSYYLPFKGHFAHPKSVSEENGQHNTGLNNDNSSKTSLFPVKRRCQSQLQINASPSNASTSPLRESKHIENATGSINRLVPHSAALYHRPKVSSSNDSKAKNVFLEENGRSCSTLVRNYSSLMSSLYPKEHAGDFLATLNPPEPLSSSGERYSTEDIVESVSQSFASLSMTSGVPTTDASEMPIPSKEPNPEQSAHSRNKTRKKSKLISFFTACLRPSSPRQGGQT
ncbi:hypothetical protein AVEN_1198-1 [Araneus ventricosus]|uniref:Uncharacterized protein n=1 Tax=Araneus ventricosus TaxID=182803 RepID=A0A4Y2SY23_ARAVE|nr:hypothetical protein AVEN_120937-1 [Araneus ventricosus]GBN91801.1 hypothetical protein AVEN_1198-1 [Araneus ventricosus]